MSDLERFMKYVRKDESGCWLWTGGLFKEGYGRVRRGPKSLGAHRVSYELFKGALGPDQCVRHTCDVRACVNPEHLIPGSNHDNVVDRQTRQRQASGSRNGRAKMNEAQAEAIRQRYAAGGVSLRALAAEVGVSHVAVQKIVNGETWLRTGDAANDTAHEAA